MAKEEASGVSEEKLWHHQLVCFPRNLIDSHHHKIEVSLGYLKGCLGEQLMALRPFLQLQSNHVGVEQDSLSSGRGREVAEFKSISNHVRG